GQGFRCESLGRQDAADHRRTSEDGAGYREGRRRGRHVRQEEVTCKSEARSLKSARSDFRLQTSDFRLQTLNLRNAPMPPTAARSDGSSMNRTVADVFCACMIKSFSPLFASGRAVITSSSTCPSSSARRTFAPPTVARPLAR